MSALWMLWMLLSEPKKDQVSPSPFNFGLWTLALQLISAPPLINIELITAQPCCLWSIISIPPLCCRLPCSESDRWSGLGLGPELLSQSRRGVNLPQQERTSLAESEFNAGNYCPAHTPTYSFSIWILFDWLLTVRMEWIKVELKKSNLPLHPHLKYIYNLYENFCLSSSS